MKRSTIRVKRRKRPTSIDKSPTMKNTLSRNLLNPIRLLISSINLQYTSLILFLNQKLITLKTRVIKKRAIPTANIVLYSIVP